MTRASVVAAAVVLTLPAFAVYPQEHAQPQGAPTEKFGTVHFTTSCSPRVAPQFDRAVALLHSFEFGASIRAFNGVLAADSTCAMAHWGIALSRWTNPMAAGNRSIALLRQGKQAVDAAMRLGVRASERERGYIHAVSRLYDDFEHKDQRTRIVAYERAMTWIIASGSRRFTSATALARARGHGLSNCNGALRTSYSFLPWSRRRTNLLISRIAGRSS